MKTPALIYGRPKSIHSIWNKIKNKEVPFEEIYDLFAIRIIIDVPKEREKMSCYQIYSILTDRYQPIPERLKDFITNPKANGYESLHTTVMGPKGRFVEIQIRSERMEAVAERGLAAHWRYKGVSGTSKRFEEWLANIREMLDNPSEDAVEFINDFKTNLFSEEVFIYTPKGDMKILPKGATALDFAFMIHTEVGYHCHSAKVNNKQVPLGYKLKNGDQISIKTSKNQKPRQEWLKMAVTGKARSKIRSAMKEEKRQKGLIGMETLERKLRHLKVDFEENMETLVQHFGFKNRPDLYFAIAQDKFNLTARLKEFDIVGNKLILKKQEETKPAPVEEVVPKANNRVKGKPKLFINSEPADNFKYQLATCCNPVQGDDVFGYLSAKNILKIHRTTCLNANHMMANYGYRIVRVDWGESQDTSFVADLIVIGVDGIGILQRISNVITNNLRINMRSISMKGDQGYFEGKISIVVNNKDQLQFTIQTLKSVEGVTNVTRLD